MKKRLKAIIYTVRLEVWQSIMLGAQLLIIFVLLGNIFIYFICGEIVGKENSNICNEKNGYIYYKLYINSERSSQVDTTEICFLRNMENTLRQLRTSDDFIYISSSLKDFIGVDRSEIENHFKIYNSDGTNSTFFNSMNKENRSLIAGNEYSWMEAVRFDKMAMEHYKIKAREGRVFNEQDFLCDFKSKKISILLGAAYWPYFQTGDEITIYSNGEEFDAKVIGVLEERTIIKNDETYEHMGEPEISLDYKIIIPYMYLKEGIRSEKERRFIENEYINQLTGSLVFSTGVSLKNINKQLKEINEYYLDNHIFTVRPSLDNNGLVFFQSENHKSMKMLGVETIVLIVFYGCSICINVFNEIDRNYYRHSIEIINGVSLLDIVSGYVIQFLAICSFGIIVSINLNKFWLYQGLDFWLSFLLIFTTLEILCASAIYHKIVKIDLWKVVKGKRI